MARSQRDVGSCLSCGTTNPDAFRTDIFGKWSRRRDGAMWHKLLCDACWWVIDQVYDPREMDKEERERFLSIVAVLRRSYLYVPDRAERIAEYFEHEEVVWLEPRE